MLVAKASEPPSYQLRCQLPVGGRYRQELAAQQALGGPAFVDVHMRGIGADHSFERPQHQAETKDVSRRTVEDQVRLPGSRSSAEPAQRSPGEFVVAICRRVADVSCRDRRENIGVHSGMIVASETLASNIRHGIEA
jgi:hypothetical protein